MYSSSSLPGFIKRCLCFLIASTYFSSFQEWTINLSLRAYSLKKIAVDSEFVTQFTFFY